MASDGGRRQWAPGSRGSLWRRCQRIVDTLDLPSPFDAEAFIVTLGQRRGRPITLLPVPSRPDTPCGLLVTTDRSDYIFYPTDTTPLHQQHILLHEAAHLICGHTTAPATVSAQSLLPHLPVSLVERVLGRVTYAQPHEREAEAVASLILYRAWTQDQDARPSSRLADLFNARRPAPRQPGD